MAAAYADEVLAGREPKVSKGQVLSAPEQGCAAWSGAQGRTFLRCPNRRRPGEPECNEGTLNKRTLLPEFSA